MCQEGPDQSSTPASEGSAELPALAGSSSKAPGEDLFDAASTGDTAQVQTLLAAKAPVVQTDHRAHTALILASMEGHSAPTELLLAAPPTRLTNPATQLSHMRLGGC